MYTKLGDETCDFAKYINMQRGKKCVQYVDELIAKKGLERARSSIFSLPSVQKIGIKRTEVGHSREDLILLIYKVLRAEDREKKITEKALIASAKNNMKKTVHYNTPSQYEDDRLTLREEHEPIMYYAEMAKAQGIAQVSEEQPMIIAKKGCKPFSRHLIREYNQRLLEQGLYYKGEEHLEFSYEIKDENQYTISDGLQELGADIKKAKEKMSKFANRLRVAEVPHIEVPIDSEARKVLHEKENKLPKIVQEAQKSDRMQKFLKRRIRNWIRKGKLRQPGKVDAHFPAWAAAATLPVAGVITDIVDQFMR